MGAEVVGALRFTGFGEEVEGSGALFILEHGGEFVDLSLVIGQFCGHISLEMGPCN